MALIYKFQTGNKLKLTDKEVIEKAKRLNDPKHTGMTDLGSNYDAERIGKMQTFLKEYKTVKPRMNTDAVMIHADLSNKKGSPTYDTTNVYDHARVKSMQEQLIKKPIPGPIKEFGRDLDYFLNVTMPGYLLSSGAQAGSKVGLKPNEELFPDGAGKEKEKFKSDWKKHN